MKNGFIQKLRIAAVLLAFTATMTPKVSMAMPSCSEILSACGIQANETKHGDFDNCDARYTQGSEEHSTCIGSALDVWDLAWERCLSTYEFCTQEENAGDCGNGQPGGNP